MKGIGRTVYQMLCGTRLQRYLIAIGLPVALFALAMLAGQPHLRMAPLLGLAAVLGVVAAVIAPAFAGGWLFRDFSAPCAVGLIPYGRLKLLLGALLTQALLAGLITLVLAVAVARSSVTVGAGHIYAGVFAALSGQFLVAYYAAPFRGAVAPLGFIIYILGPRFVSFTFPTLTARDVIDTGLGESCLVAAATLAWLALAAAALRSQRITAPFRSGSMPSLLQSSFHIAGRSYASRSPLSRLDRPRATRALLTGSLGNRRLTIMIALGCALLFGYAYFVAPFRYSAWNPGQHFPMGLPLVVSGLAGGAAAYPMMSRARSLWLTAGLSRPTLFRIIEAQSWRVLLIVTGLTLALTATLAIFAPLRRATLVWMLLTPPATGATMIYLTLLWIRERRVTDAPIVVIVTVILIGVFAVVLTNTEGSLPFELLGVQLLLAPALRALAYLRWKRIEGTSKNCPFDAHSVDHVC